MTCVAGVCASALVEPTKPVTYQPNRPEGVAGVCASALVERSIRSAMRLEIQLGRARCRRGLRLGLS